MKKVLIYSVLCLTAVGLLLFTTVPAHAQKKEGMSGPAQGRAQMEKEMAEGEKAAGISQKQREELKVLREGFRNKQKALREQIKAKRETMRQELDSTNPDRAKVEGLAREMNALQGQAAMNRIDEVFKVRAVLTPEQYQKLLAFHEKNRKNKDKMKEKMGDRKKGGAGWHGRDGMSGSDSEDMK